MYFEGVGTYTVVPGRMGKGIYSAFEMALAWFVLPKYLSTIFFRSNRYRSVEKNVKFAYHWLAENYRKGDQVYLFGASRSAASSGR